jgi:LysR family transcriptional regulator, carnitine catabolism transcriptional activator
MSVKIEHLQSFVTVARLGSFTQAARLLHVSQPALTVQINQLEASLNYVRLLDRTTRYVRLTKVGQEILPDAQRIISEVDELVTNATRLSKAKESVVNMAAISSVASVLLPLAISGFYESYPGVKVQIEDAFSDKVVSLVREDQVDFGIASPTEIPADIQMNPLFRDRLSAVFTQEPRLAHKQSVRLEDLVDLPLILMTHGTSNRKLIERAFQSICHFVKPRYEAARISTAVALAEAGLGVAILPSTLFLERRDRRLQVVPIQNEMLYRDIGIILRLGRHLSPDAERFMNCLKDVRQSLHLELGQDTGLTPVHPIRSADN